MLQKAVLKDMDSSKRPLMDPLLQTAIVNVVGTSIFWMILEELEKEEKNYEASRLARKNIKKIYKMDNGKQRNNG